MIEDVIAFGVGIGVVGVWFASSRLHGILVELSRIRAIAANKVVTLNLLEVQADALSNRIDKIEGMIQP